MIKCNGNQGKTARPPPRKAVKKMTGLGTWTCRIDTPLIKDKPLFTIFDNGGRYGIRFRMRNYETDNLDIIEAEESGNTLRFNVAVDKFKPGATAVTELNFDGDRFTGFIRLPIMGKLKLVDGEKVEN